MAIDSIDPNLWHLDTSVFLALRDALDENYTYELLFRVMPPVYSRGLWNAIHVQSQRCRSTPAEVLLHRLGDQGVRASLFIKWLEKLGLERILLLLKDDEPLKIVENPPAVQNLKEGSTLSLKCQATSFPSPVYQWFRGDDELLFCQKPELVIENVKPENSGTYRCRVHKVDSSTGALKWDFSTATCVKITPQKILYDEGKRDQEKDSSIFSEEDQCLYLSDIEVEKRKNNDSTYKKGSIHISKHPVCPKSIPVGTSLKLSCEGVSSFPTDLYYQWICGSGLEEGREIPGAIFSDLHLNNIGQDNHDNALSWHYICKVYNGMDCVFSNPVTVRLEPSDSDKFYALEKVALLIACDEYINIPGGLSSSNDVETLADILHQMDFKILAFQNLTLRQMENVISLYCELLRPGTYSLIYYGGHSFEYYKQMFLQPIDCGSKLCPEECISADYILECIQKSSPALNVVFLDGCRYILDDYEPSLKAPPRVYVPDDCGNTVMCYATSLSQPACEFEYQSNSCFVKYLKKYLSRKMKIQDILMHVQGDIQTDYLVKNIQFPVMCTSLKQPRMLWDVVEDPEDSVFDEKVPWADIKYVIFEDECVVDAVFKSEHNIESSFVIVIEVGHHRNVFCNGIDVSVFLKIDKNTNLAILKNIVFNLEFSSPVVNEIMKKLDYQPKNKVGKKCLQAVFQIQGVQNIEEQLSADLSLTFEGKCFITVNFDFGTHPVQDLELNKPPVQKSELNDDS